ncbi:MAG: hypothetical protein ACR2JZ_06310 [Candidatus Limnocylindrales bacterium]
MSPLQRIGLAALLGLVAAACGATPGGQMGSPSNLGAATQGTSGYPGWPGSGSAVGSPDLVPVLISSELAVGPNRFLFSLLDGQNRLLAKPDVATSVGFFDLAADPEAAVETAEGDFLWSIEGEQGLYVSQVDFARAGDWGVEVTAEGPSLPKRTTRVVFGVREESRTPAIGAPAPASDTPTAETADEIAAISTDEAPDPDFYRLSVADAVKAGKPAVITFATPKFCSSRVCGPTLDIVKGAAAPFKDEVNFVHVEVFTNLDQPDQLKQAPSVTEWGLPSEPWVFVVDREGKVSAKFEGVVGEEELTEAINSVS